MAIVEFLDMTIEQLAGNFMLKFENSNPVEKFLSYRMFESAWRLSIDSLSPTPTVTMALIDHPKTYAEAIFNDTAHEILSIQDLIVTETVQGDDIHSLVQIGLGLAFLYVVTGSLRGKRWEILSPEKVIKFAGEFFAEFEVTYPKMVEVMKAD